MAYFGRKLKKPQSLPGAASGGPVTPAEGGSPSAAPGNRQARPQRMRKAVRAARAERSQRR